MKSITKRVFVIFITLFMIIGIAHIPNALAEETALNDEMDVSGSKTVNKTELTNNENDNQTTVTLSLPSGEYKNKIDVVFVMDNSTSVANAQINFAENVQSLFEKIVEGNPGIELKVGVVKFRGYATDMLGTGLTVYDESSQGAIVAAIANKEVPGSGSNVHSGLMMAEDLLSEDTEVEDSHKYVILLTDCKSYIWNNDDGEPVTYYAQSFRLNSIQSSGKPYLNQWNGIYNMEAGQTYNTFPKITEKEIFYVRSGQNITADNSTTKDYYEELYNVKNEEIASTSTVYDSPAYYSKYYESYSGTATPGDGTVTTHPVANAAEAAQNNARYTTYYEYVPQAGTFWEDVRYLQLNPYIVVQNDAGEYVYDTEQINEDFYMWHPSGMEKGIYQAGHYWKETIGSKYNTAAIALYKNDGTGDKIVGSFQKWLFANSDYSADVTNSDQVIALFDGIDNSIRYMVNKGTVTDIIEEHFDLVIPEDGSSPFTATLDGETLTVTKSDGENTWNIGTAADDGTYPYVVSYDADKKTITWEINVPIENLRPVTLSYTLEVVEGTETGEYETNESAVLEYSTTDKGDGTYPFEKPVVNYTVYADYQVEYYLQNLDGTYTIVTEDTVKGRDVVGKEVTAEEKTYEHYVVNKEAEGTKESGTIVVDNSLVLKLYYDRETFTVIYQPGEQGTFTEQKTENIMYGADTPKAPETTHNVGYEFDGWKPEVADTVTEDATYVAQWKAAETKYTVKHYQQNLEDDEYTLVEKDTKELTGKTGTEVTAEPNEYEGFTYNEEISKATGTVLGDGSLVLNLYYTRNMYEITYKMNGGNYKGSTEDIIEKYKYGTVIKIHEAPVREGYKFTHWEGSKYNPGDEYTVTENHTFVAQWENDIVPATGDNSNLTLWLTLLGISTVGTAGFAVVTAKKRKEEEE